MNSLYAKLLKRFRNHLKKQIDMLAILWCIKYTHAEIMRRLSIKKFHHKIIFTIICLYYVYFSDNFFNKKN